MGKYVPVHYDGAGSDGGRADAWGIWYGELDERIIDAGNPFAKVGQVVHQGGVMDFQNKPVTGYPIIIAENQAYTDRMHTDLVEALLSTAQLAQQLRNTR